MNKSLIAAVVAAALTWPTLACAQSTERIDKRQELQQKRIDKGVASGKLNKREAARLEKGQEHVQKLEDKALADGKVTAAEKARVERAQDVQSRRIARQKHDRQKAKAN